MAKDETAALKQLAKLLPLAKDLHEKIGAILDDWDRVLGGGAGIGENLRGLEQAWQRAWSARYRSDYVFNFAKDRAQLKRLLRGNKGSAGLTPIEIQIRILNYLRSDDPYHVKARHPFGLFLTCINSYADASAPKELQLEAPTVADCKHEPRCSSDQRHTQRKMQEMRA